jgi:VanZ family protein
MRWLPALAWMGLIFVLSAQSGLRVSEDASVDAPFRVVAHLGTYAILGGLLLFALTARMPLAVHVAVLAFGLAVVYGVTDEVHQAFVPARTGEISDVVADSIGAALGVTFTWWILSRRARRLPT